MRKNLQTLIVVGLIGTIATGEVWAGTYSAEKKESKIVGSISTKNISIANYPKLAKISSGSAAKVATELVSGDILSVGLESEDSYLVYAVEIASLKSGIHELIVDAGNGQVLANQQKNLEKDEEGEDSDD